MNVSGPARAFPVVASPCSSLNRAMVNALAVGGWTPELEKTRAVPSWRVMSIWF